MEANSRVVFVLGGIALGLKVIMDFAVPSSLCFSKSPRRDRDWIRNAHVNDTRYRRSLLVFFSIFR